MSATDSPSWSAPIPVSSPPAQRVLLAEDNRTCQDYVRTVLMKAGVAVDIVCNGEEAIGALSKADYALVLMDCLMPVMGGADAARLIRSGTTSARDPQIPIIAITAHAFQVNADDCMLAGMNDYVTKPVSADALRQIVRRWIMPVNQPDEADAEIPATCILFADRSRSPG